MNSRDRHAAGPATARTGLVAGPGRQHDACGRYECLMMVPGRRSRQQNTEGECFVAPAMNPDRRQAELKQPDAWLRCRRRAPLTAATHRKRRQPPAASASLGR